MPGEDAPEHRHTQHAFRFVVEGSGSFEVTAVGDAVTDFRPGDRVAVFSQQASPGFIELWSLQSRMAHRLRTRDEG